MLPKVKVLLLVITGSQLFPLNFTLLKSRAEHSSMESVQRPTVLRSILPSMQIMVGIVLPESFDAPLGCQTGEASQAERSEREREF